MGILGRLKSGFEYAQELLVSIIRQFYRNNGFVLSGALSFFALLSILPLAYLIISLLGWFLPETYLPFVQEFLQNFIPVQMKSEVSSSIAVLMDLKLGFSFKRLFQSLLAIIFSVWLASLIFDIMERILAVTFHVKRGRPFWKSKLTHMFLMANLGSLYFTLSVLAAFLQILGETVQGKFPGIYDTFLYRTGLISVLPVLVSVIFSATLFFILYKASTPQKLKNRSYIRGAIFASFFWVIARYIFGIYIEKINDFSLFFGTLAVIARIALWVFYSSVIFILGAEVCWFVENRAGPEIEEVKT